MAVRIADPEYRSVAITRSLNALALLASGNKKYLSIVKKEAEWASAFTSNGYKTWHYGYVIIFLAEYIIATGDQSVLPGLRRLALESADGQSIVGSWGHRFVQKNTGRLGGYGMMNSPGIPLTIGLVLAKKAGVNDPKSQRQSKKVQIFFVFIQEKEPFLMVTIGHGFRHMMIMVKTGWPRSFLTYSTSLNTPNISPG